MSKSSTPKKPKELFTASEVAKFCQVDLKTIHNWADRGEVRHFRTPGRHLRFRRVDVLDFLRRYGYPIPSSLMQGRPRVMVLVDENEENRDSMIPSGEEFEVAHSDSVFDALLQIGSEPPDAIVIGETFDGTNGLQIAEKVTAWAPQVRAVLVSEHPPEGSESAGISATLRLQDSVDTSLKMLLGLNRVE